MAIGDVTAWVETTADSSGLHWTAGAATLSVTGTRSVTLDEMRLVALGLEPVDASSVPVNIEPISPAQPAPGPDGTPPIVAGPDDPGDEGPFGRDWSKAPVVEALRTTPLDWVRIPARPHDRRSPPRDRRCRVAPPRLGSHTIGRHAARTRGCVNAVHRCWGGVVRRDRRLARSADAACHPGGVEASAVEHDAQPIRQTH